MCIFRKIRYDLFICFVNYPSSVIRAINNVQQAPILDHY